ncbi:serine/threonine-protein phosphatase 6 regulatory ankyrin repeat subunit B-like [Haliotis rubra]|uniref:serine/threonine-protein phosphatase 6 regulatory ankyrin repeat subunit B-like n=1 Tax=Haliotis rubra TaxID=36100 RepID=UPI001EE52B26|nr:serine/threonine-protein phosphatase 6 regulatory ankyrin repeat subunit B-like [Haliotis rubra]
MVDVLVKRGVDLNAMDSRGTTALRLAIEDMIYDAAELILKHGNTDREFDPNRRDDFGKTYLHYATEQRKSELWERFLDTPTLFSYSFSQYWYLQSPCMLYCARANYTLTKMLLEQGVNPHLQDIMGRNPLHYAAGCGKPKTVKLLLEKGVDPNVRDGMGWTPFHMAAVHERYRTVSALLDSGIDANIQDNQGMTALHLVVTKRGFTLQMLEANNDYAELSCLGPCGFLKLFLEKGVDPNIPDKLGRTALHYASDHSENSSVMLLLDHGADPDVQDLWGMTSLHCASTKKGSVFKDTLPLLLEKSLKLNVQDRRGKTALHYASEYPKKESVKLLLDRGADPSVQDLQGMTYLHCAAANSYGALQTLIERGVDPNILDKKGRTALHYVSGDSEDSVKFLLDRCADPGVQDLQGMSALHCAVHLRPYRSDILPILLERGIYPNLLDKHGRTALHYASEHSNKESVMLLLDHEADPCLQDLQGMTCLHCAAKNRYSYHILEILLEKSVDPNVLDKKGRTALHYASEHSNKESVKLLLDHEADPGVHDLQGMTPLHCAAKARDNTCDILEMLLEKSVDPNVLDKKGRTALHYALEQSPVKNIKPVQHGAYTEVQNLFANIPLHPKPLHPRPSDTIPLLTKTGARRTTIYRSEFEQEYGILLCEYRRMKMLEMLLKKVNPKIQDHEGRTALHYAAQASRNETLEILSELGVTVNKQNDQDRAFFRAAADRSYNRCERVKLLLRQGVDKTVRDIQGRTAEQYATELSDISP